MAAVTLQVPSLPKEQPAQASSAEEDELDLRWLEDRLSWAARLGETAQALRDSGERSERGESEQGERWLEEFAELRCDFRRRSRRLEKLENKMHAVTSSCIEAQHHLASLTRERDLLMDCVQELLLLTTSDMQDPAQRHCAPSKAREAWQSKDGDTSEPVAKDVAAGGSRATPRSVRNSTSPRDLLKAPEGARRVRFDDKLQESPRYPRQPPDRHSASLHNPILKHHRPTLAVPTPEAETVSAGGASAVDARTSECEQDAGRADEEAQAVLQEGGSDELRRGAQVQEPLVMATHVCAGQRVVLQSPLWHLGQPGHQRVLAPQPRAAGGAVYNHRGCNGCNGQVRWGEGAEAAFARAVPVGPVQRGTGSSPT
ncbi:unnamed protein product [Symbiodinium sp. CCMP2592]|nr:unnamed protein product [Symbiodinium sp. CCMP2592]